MFIRVHRALLSPVELGRPHPRAFDLGGEVGQSDLRRCNRTLPAQRHAIDQQ